MKVTSRGGFSTLRANNCVFKNKWFYEIRLNTNKLAQLGWSQLITRYTAHEGVGDDNTSFAYDGYRLVKWPNGSTQYGLLWDIGDVVGCCIDLQNKNIEYFLNGISMGLAFENIPTGENIAYFPAVSLSENETVTFNFGNTPFEYEYPGYEPIDIPKSRYNGAENITFIILKMLNDHLLSIMSCKNMHNYQKLSVISKIIVFLTSVSFKDPYILKVHIIPFLVNLSNSKRTQDIHVLLDYCLNFMREEEKKEFVNHFYENLCNIIEEKGTSRINLISEWKNLVKLFVDLLYMDSFVQYWLTSSPNKCNEHLKCLFNTSTTNMNEIYQTIKQENINNDKSLYLIFKSMKKSVPLDIDSRTSDSVFNENLQSIIFIFLTDPRTFKKGDTIITLKSVLSELENTYSIINNNYNHHYIHTYAKYNTALLKNIAYSQLQIFSQYLHIPLESFSIEPWYYNY